ncbi:hypothetical protein [Enterobacter hormaechei]|uniref:hypothetical protein n=1 Tax=Enterobacter hormaechei TaxID=158836 RepID=UPI0039E5B19E
MYLKWCILIIFVLLVSCKDAPNEPESSVIKRTAAQEQCGVCDSDKTRQLILRKFIETTFSNLAQRPLELSRLNGGEGTDPVYYFANDFRDDIFRTSALTITNVSNVPSTYHHCTCSAKIQFASDAFGESVAVVNYRYCVTEKTDVVLYKLPGVSLYDMYINNIPLVRLDTNG